MENKEIQEEIHSTEESINVNRDQCINKKHISDDITTQNLLLSENKDILNDLGPITKLEQRFKETMEKVAELTDEKQKLEHLVLQLQGETETIGKLIFKKFCSTYMSYLSCKL